MLEEVYAEAKECVALLGAAGFGDDAGELDRGLYGATSGEALALLGAASKRILRDRKDLPSDLRERLVRLRRAVDKVLRSVR